MATTRFKPLELGLIEEGRLEADLNTEFAKIQSALCAYQEKWEASAKGATAEVNLKIKIKCEDPQDGIFTVVGSVTSKIPARPARTTTAIKGDDDEGKTCLFGRASGTTEDTPDQGVLMTKDGRIVDQDTGEAEE